MMTELTACKNCGASFAGNYCNNCGEKKFSPKDNSILHLLEQGFHFITHFDGSLLRTLRAIATRPEKFSAEYSMGIRKKYFKPLSFFLFIVVLYLIFPLFDGLNMNLHFYEQNGFYGSYAKKQIAGLLPAYGNFAALADAFHRKSEKLAKFLLFILIPAMAAITTLLTIRRKRSFYDHFLFNTEEMSFFILWGFLIFPLFLLLLSLFIPAARKVTDNISGIFIFVGVAIHAAVASRRFFGLRRVQSILFSIFFCAGLYFAVPFIYKFILFFITVRLLG